MTDSDEMRRRRAWDTVARFMNLRRTALDNYPRFVEALSEALESGAWKDFTHEGTGNRKRFENFRDFLDWSGCKEKELLAVLTARGDEGLLARVRAELAGELAEPGRPAGKVRGANDSKRQDDANYLVARLKRDRPDLAERVMAGRLSPNAAAVVAGFRKPYLRIRGDDVKRAMTKAAEHFGAAECRAALDEIEGTNP